MIRSDPPNGGGRLMLDLRIAQSPVDLELRFVNRSHDTLHQGFP